jgi:hypothetical protein
LFEHLSHFTRWQVPELSPSKLAAGFVIRTVEKDDVEMKVQPQVTRRALHRLDYPRSPTTVPRPSVLGERGRPVRVAGAVSALRYM